MIEVTIVETGDRASAETAEEAVFAARTMGREARAAAATQGFDPHITFAVDGLIVGTATLRSLDR